MSELCEPVACLACHARHPFRTMPPGHAQPLWMRRAARWSTCRTSTGRQLGLTSFRRCCDCLSIVTVTVPGSTRLDRLWRWFPPAVVTVTAPPFPRAGISSSSRWESGDTPSDHSWCCTPARTPREGGASRFHGQRRRGTDSRTMTELQAPHSEVGYLADGPRQRIAIAACGESERGQRTLEISDHS